MSNDDILGGYIIKIIQNNQIREQNDIREILKHSGYDVSQATLSRHFKRLKIAKIDGIYRLISLPSHNIPFVLNLQISAFGMIVMHTHPGNASSLAYFIDQRYVNYSNDIKSFSSILGTIAGDDTVLLIMQSNDNADILEKIYQDFPYLQKQEKD